MQNKGGHAEMMEGLSKKKYLELKAPDKADAVSAKERILRELKQEFGKVRMSCTILRMLYPLCEQAEWKLTVTLGWNGQEWEMLCLEQGSTVEQHYGICADLGSTTVAVQLVNCHTGEILAQESIYNEQIRFGKDILNRIFYAKDQPDHLEELRLAAVETFWKAFRKLEEKTGISPESYASMVVAGNMTMVHFLIGMDAFCVFSSPYAVWADRPDFLRASELGFSFPGYVYCYPAKANYMGGDIISGIIASGIADREEVSVFLDVGTNGELVIGSRDFLLCGAGAAGPALEGGSVKTGMTAGEGAVQYVKLDGKEFTLDVIGGGTPKGICGSGIVDLIAELFLRGWVDIRGQLVPEASEKIRFLEEEYAVEYAPSLYFYQSDLDEFLNTKAAAFTMVEYMMNLIGLPMDAIGQFLIAGAFGTHICKESAVTIGMYPDLERERLVLPGNTSLKGAYEMLLHRENLEKAEKIIEKMEYVQFGEVEQFIHLMDGARALPHTDLERYPSVQKKLRELGTWC